MNNATTIKRITESLPDETRERFLAICDHLHTAEDDEEFLLLQGMGLLMSEMREVPEALATMLDETKRGLTEDQATRLGNQFSEILKGSLELPAYQDMERFHRTMRDASETQKRETSKLREEMRSARVAIGKYARVLPVLSSSVLSSVIVLVIGSIIAWFLVPYLFRIQRVSVPETLWPYVELERQARLRHLDTEVDGIRGRALIIEDVVNARLDGKNAFIVIELPNPEVAQ